MGSDNGHTVKPFGNSDEVAGWLPLVYDELRRIAAGHMRRERRGHTLDATAVVHEAWTRLDAQRKGRWRSRGQFCAVASRLMRRILIDHARKRMARQRGEAERGLDASTSNPSTESRPGLLALHDELKCLATLDTQRARLVELRFFGGLTIDESADVLGIGRDRAKADWRLARAWLHARLER